MIEIETLIFILEEGIKKYGEKPLTNKWLLNILKKASKYEDAFVDYGPEEHF